jgi:predicted metal-dependent phosphoesterase TrpH
MTMMRADLHVHTLHSTRSGNMRFLRSRDCYSRPIDVYRCAKSRGMDLIAITDHDSIDGALELAGSVEHPDEVIIGEEVSCWHRDIQVHLGVYGMTEALHRDIQPLRRNAFDVIACLRSAGVFFSLNHLLHFYRGQAPLAEYLRLLEEVPALEVRNGAMLPAHNQLIEEIVSRRAARNQATLAAIGGSDAHTLRRVGRTWTEAPGRNREEFLESLKRGLGRPGGDHGGASAVACDTYGVICSFIASLMGLGPRDHAGWHRAGCLAFSGVSLPLQFLPLAIALAAKRAEGDAVRRVTAELNAVAAHAPQRPVQIEGASR